MPHYFFSDVHLGYGDRTADRAREQTVIRFLESIRDTAEGLFIVGDLFDYWFDYATVIPRGHIRILNTIGEFVRGGCPVHYSIGNHDFGHHSFFRDELGVVMHDDDYEITLGTTRFYISHGDGKALNDGGYRVLKSILRNPVSRRLYALLHPDIGIGIASWVSRSSRGYTDRKDYGQIDGLELFARQKLRDGYDVVVMGHRHRPQQVWEGQGTYVNLGDWLFNRTFGVFDGTVMVLRKYEEAG